MECWGYSKRMWDIQDVKFMGLGCWGCRMLGMQNVGDVSVADVGCWRCGMFRMWDVGDVG